VPVAATILPPDEPPDAGGAVSVDEDQLPLPGMSYLYEGACVREDYPPAESLRPLTISLTVEPQRAAPEQYRDVQSLAVVDEKTVTTGHEPYLRSVSSLPADLPMWLTHESSELVRSRRSFGRAMLSLRILVLGIRRLPKSDI
jgi:hypothetical protein